MKELTVLFVMFADFVDSYNKSAKRKMRIEAMWRTDYSDLVEYKVKNWIDGSPVMFVEVSFDEYGRLVIRDSNGRSAEDLLSEMAV